MTAVQSGGLEPLLGLMASRNGNLQHNAAFALYGLADSDDNIAAIVRHGGVQALHQCELLVQVRPQAVCLHISLQGRATDLRIRAVLVACKPESSAAC